MRIYLNSFMALVVYTVINPVLAEDTMKIQINNTDYTVTTDNNKTTSDIIANMPFDLNVSLYDNHEYYATLPFTPRTDGNQTSHLLAGHIYYWAGGNSFVINFADFDISPYSSVHIGEIVDKSAIDAMRNIGDKIDIKVIK